MVRLPPLPFKARRAWYWVGVRPAAAAAASLKPRKRARVWRKAARVSNSRSLTGRLDDRAFGGAGDRDRDIYRATIYRVNTPDNPPHGPEELGYFSTTCMLLPI